MLTGSAVDVREPEGIDRWRTASLADAAAVSLNASLSDHVQSGSRPTSDVRQGYARIEQLGYDLDRRSQRAAAARGEDPVSCCKLCTASLVKR